jgi:hypothetical protein
VEFFLHLRTGRAEAPSSLSMQDLASSVVPAGQSEKG